MFRALFSPVHNPNSTAQSEVQQDFSALFEGFVNSQYSKTRKEFWANLTSFVQRRCEAELRKRGIQAAVTSRVKAADSLRKTLPRLNQRRIRNRERFEKEQRDGQHPRGDPNPYPAAYRSHADILNDALDIAGIRISIYFPDQLPDVRAMLEDKRWIKRSIHKTFAERGHTPADQEMRPYEERFGYYPADHFSIRLAPGAIDQDQVPEYADEPIEVQVRTVLIDAWAEVRHDLVYKVLGGHTHLSHEELRVLDSLKGLAATGELLLEHLHLAHRKRLERDRREFPAERENFVSLLVETLQVRHQPLLDLFDGNMDDWEELRYILQHLGVLTPEALKQELSDLQTKHQILEEVKRVECALGAVSLSSFLLCYLSQRHSNYLFTSPPLDLIKYFQIICFTLSWLDERLKPSEKPNESEVTNWCFLFHLHEWIALMIHEIYGGPTSPVLERISKGASRPLAREWFLKTMRKLVPHESDAVKMPIYMSLAKALAGKRSEFDLEKSRCLRRGFIRSTLLGESHHHGPPDLFRSAGKAWDDARLEVASITGRTSLDLALAVARRAIVRGHFNLVEHYVANDEIKAYLSKAGGRPREGFQHDVSRILIETAVIGSDEQMLKLFLGERAIDLNCPDEWGGTPLHLAVLIDDESMVAMLLQDPRTNPYARDRRKHTWLTFWRSKYPNGSVFLRFKGTALDYAISTKKADIAKVLLWEMEKRGSLMRQWRPLIKYLEASGFDEGLKCRCLPLRTLRALGLVFLRLEEVEVDRPWELQYILETQGIVESVTRE